MDIFLVDSIVDSLISENRRAATSETSARHDDQEMEDATTSNPGMICAVSLSVDWIFIFNFEPFL